MPNMERVKGFVLNGVLAARELEELQATLPEAKDPIVALSKMSESTDPSWYTPDLIQAARRMTEVYFRIYLFETQVRQLVDRVLTEAKGADWFDAPELNDLKDGAETRRNAEGAAKFHGQRGDNLLSYLTLSELGRLIILNWEHFEDLLYRKDWVQAKFDELRLTRNATAHMGLVSSDDLARLDLILKDWNRQVG